jgi:hypothetical protein
LPWARRCARAARLRNPCAGRKWSLIYSLPRTFGF